MFGDHIAYPDLDQVAAAGLAIDRKIEQGTIANAALAIKEEADCPDLFLGERTLGSHLLASVQRRARMAAFGQLARGPNDRNEAQSSRSIANSVQRKPVTAISIPAIMWGKKWVNYCST